MCAIVLDILDCSLGETNIFQVYLGCYGNKHSQQIMWELFVIGYFSSNQIVSWLFNIIQS